MMIIIIKQEREREKEKFKFDGYFMTSYSQYQQIPLIQIYSTTSTNLPSAKSITKSSLLLLFFAAVKNQNGGKKGKRKCAFKNIRIIDI